MLESRSKKKEKSHKGKHLDSNPEEGASKSSLEQTEKGSENSIYKKDENDGEPDIWIHLKGDGGSMQEQIFSQLQKGFERFEGKFPVNAMKQFAEKMRLDERMTATDGYGSDINSKSPSNAERTLEEIGLVLSPSQPRTPGIYKSFQHLKCY